MPFPSSLVGEHILTDHAAPAVLFFMMPRWHCRRLAGSVITQAALKDHLGKSEKSNFADSQKWSIRVFAFILYPVFAILAIWFPLIIAAITTVTWIFWLVWGIRLKHVYN
jgi:hypothetical protein